MDKVEAQILDVIAQNGRASIDEILCAVNAPAREIDKAVMSLWDAGKIYMDTPTVFAATDNT